MYRVSLINEMNIYEGNKRDIYEYPVDFETYEEAVKSAQTYIEAGHAVAIEKT